MSLAQQYLPPMEAAMLQFSISSPLRAWMWLAQVGHESASLRYFEEIASGAAYEGRTDLGNTQPGDGKRYKGRGPIQITGRANYTAAAAALGLPLVEHPEMAADPAYAFLVSAWWWQAHGLNEISDTGDVVAATRRINGGLNGLADRQARYAKCKALGTAAVPTLPPPTEGAEDMGALFIELTNEKDTDGKPKLLWWVPGGTGSYYRGVPAGMKQNVPDHMKIKDPNGAWKAMWKVGAG